MKAINICNSARDTKDLQSGKFSSIVILNEKDLQDEDELACIFCGRNVDLLYVPRELTDEELSIILPSITDGLEYTGKVINYNK